MCYHWTFDTLFITLIRRAAFLIQLSLEILLGILKILILLLERIYLLIPLIVLILVLVVIILRLHPALCPSFWVSASRFLGGWFSAFGDSWEPVTVYSSYVNILFSSFCSSKFYYVLRVYFTRSQNSPFPYYQ